MSKFKRKKVLLVVFVLLISFALISIPIIIWLKPSRTRNVIEFFVNYEDNDIGMDIIPEGLNYNWYMDGTIIESGMLDASGILSFTIFNSDGEYILELGKLQYQGENYVPAISNYSYVHGTTYDEIEIGAKFIQSNIFWEGAIPVDNQNIDLWMLNEITLLYEYVGTFLTDSLGFVSVSVIKGGYLWKINDMESISPPIYIQWCDLGKYQDFIFTLKVLEGFIVIVALEEKAMITIFTFLKEV